jgi:hypothetical protein
MKVIIFSRGRESQLLKTLDYMNQRNIQTLVFHNSTMPLSNLDRLSNIQYFLAEIPIGGRFRLASEYIDEHTNYIIGSDDEFFSPSSLVRSEKLLNENKLVASVAIPAIGVAIGRKGFSISPAYENMYSYKNFENEVKDRFDFHFTQRVGLGSYQGAMYRAIKGIYMKELLTIMGKMENISTPYVYEIIAEIYLTHVGQAISLNEVGWVRNWIEEPVNNLNWNRSLYFSDWWNDPKYIEEVSSFKKIMKSYIPEWRDQKTEDHFWTLLLEARARLENRERLQSRKINWVRNLVRRYIYKIYRNAPKKIRGYFLNRALYKSRLVHESNEIANGILQVLI